MIKLIYLTKPAESYTVPYLISTQVVLSQLIHYNPSNCAMLSMIR